MEKNSIILIIVAIIQIYIVYRLINIERFLKNNFNKGKAFNDDELYAQAKDILSKTNKPSASVLQKELKIGYARAAHLLDMLKNKRALQARNKK